MSFEPDFSIANVPSSTLPNILCCLCGASIQPNNASMCVNCLRAQVDITDGITKQVPMFQCRGCLKYLRPPWVAVELESRQLLALCLKKIKGLNKVKLIDASFVWTEPHSKRIKVKLTVQKEVLNGVILQQTFVVEFIVQNQQCDACQKSYTADPWKAKLQLRQKVDHKRTFYYLEQVILKHGLYDGMSKIKEEADGLDLYFPNRSGAQRVLDFFGNIVPIRAKMSKRLVSQDYQSNLVNYKYTIYAEIAPICKDDLICMPRAIANQLGGVAPFQVCVRLTSNISLIDPTTCNRTDIPQLNYYKNPFVCLLSSRSLIEFVVLDIQKTGHRVGKYALAEAHVARASEMGVSDTFFIVKTHLGNLLNPGDSCLGYDLVATNFNDNDMLGLKGTELPDVILIKKAYPTKSKNKRRRWALKSIEKERDENYKKKDEARELRDLEEFCNDLEEDPDMRANVNIYKSREADTMSEMSDSENPSIPLSDMLDALNFDNKTLVLNPDAAFKEEDDDDDNISIADSVMEEEKSVLPPVDTSKKGKNNKKR